jgi:hypothetical protein
MIVRFSDGYGDGNHDRGMRRDPARVDRLLSSDQVPPAPSRTVTCTTAPRSGRWIHVETAGAPVAARMAEA